jgi:hypothetical protein
MWWGDEDVDSRQLKVERGLQGLKPFFVSDCYVAAEAATHEAAVRKSAHQEKAHTKKKQIPHFVRDDRVV